MTTKEHLIEFLKSSGYTRVFTNEWCRREKLYSEEVYGGGGCVVAFSGTALHGFDKYAEAIFSSDGSLKSFLFFDV